MWAAVIKTIKNLLRMVWLRTRAPNGDRAGVSSVSPGIEPGYIVFPSHKILYRFYWRTAVKEKKKKFLAVRRVSAWWPFASVVLTVHFQSRD
jgi:hypothetical protein